MQSFMNQSRFDSRPFKLCCCLALFAFIVMQLCVVPGGRAAADEPMLAGQSWKLNGLATPRFRIQGTETRNNPLRPQLTTPFSGDELFVRFRLRYLLTQNDLFLPQITKLGASRDQASHVLGACNNRSVDVNHLTTKRDKSQLIVARRAQLPSMREHFNRPSTT